MKNVNYKSLRRFEIGHAPTNIGYQTNKNVVSTNAFESNAGYDMRGDTQAVRSSILPSALTGLSSMGNAAMNFALNYTTEAAAKAAQTAGNTAAKVGMNTLGKAVSIAGALYGTGSMIKDFVDFSDRLRGDDLENMAATSTATKNGVAYKSIDGFNEAEALRYTDALNKLGTLSATLNGASAGMSAGSLGGPWGMAIGGVLGGLTGLFGGLFGSSKRKEKVEQDIFATKGLHYGANTLNESEAGSKGLRSQFYSGVADNGKRPGESLSGGKYGVIQTPSGPAYGEIQGLASPDEGMINIATGETKYLGSKSFGVKDKHADIVPVGIKGFADNGAFDLYVSILGHTPLNPLVPNGPTHADAARPLFKQNDQFKDMFAEIDAELELNENHKTRDKATKLFMKNKMEQKLKLIRQAYNKNILDLMALVNNLTAMTSGAYFNCGKTPRYVGGKTIPAVDLSAFKPYYGKGISVVPEIEEPKSSYIENLPEKMQLNANNEGENNGVNINPFGASYAGLSPIYGALQSLPYAIADLLAANKHTPYAQNSYVANPTAQQALNVLGSLRYDPYRQIRQLTTAGRQNLYNINNAGSLSAGQRAALASSSNIQLAQAAMNIYDKQQEMNNALAKDYATALMGDGQDAATRLQQANAHQQEAYRQAVGADQKLKAQARKNWYTLGRQNLQDFNTWLNTQGMLNLWDKQVAADEAKVGIKRPTATTSSVKSVKTSKYAPYAKDMGVKQRLAKKKKGSAPDALPYDRAGQERKLAVPVEEFEYFPWQKPIIRPGSDLYNYRYID